MKIEALQAEVACNEVLLPRLRTITEEVHGADDGPAEFSKIVERLKTNPSPEAPPSNSPNKISYDQMILSLLLQVYEGAKEKGLDKNDDRLRETLIANLKSHIAKLGETTEKLRKDLDAELSEKNKKITSESIHDGWDSHVSVT
jgi:cell division cycle protein 37